MRVLAGASTALRRIIDLGLLVLILVVLFGVGLGKVVPLTGRQTIIIGGASMEPAISLGSAVVVRPVAAADLVVGDVVSMRVGEDRTTYTHRIIALVDRPDGRWLRTRGDANGAPDPSLVAAEAVVGRVEFSVPLAGYLLALLSLPVGFLFVLGLAATLLGIAWLLESTDPGVDPAAVRGEPIAARPRVAPAIGPGLPGFAAASPSRLAQEPIPRPTVRVQLERSRETRRRRARWLTGRDRSATG